MKRYSQQMLLPEIGELGQDLLGKAHVLVVGAGGLGTVVVTYLTAIGIGKIGIVDYDTVEETNLHRQFLYTPDDIGKNKALMLKKRLVAQNNSISVDAIVERITEENFTSIIADYSIVCDCTDDVLTRLALDKQCGQNNIPLVHGAVSDWQGYITLFHYKNRFRYNHLFDMDDLLRTQTCSANGISSPVCGIIGSIMSNETLKIILNIDSNLDGSLLYINSLKNIFKIIKLKK